MYPVSLIKVGISIKEMKYSFSGFELIGNVSDQLFLEVNMVHVYASILNL